MKLSAEIRMKPAFVATYLNSDSRADLMSSCPPLLIDAWILL